MPVFYLRLGTFMPGLLSVPGIGFAALHEGAETKELRGLKN